MRVCPKCGYVDPQHWRRSFQRNPGGEIDICRIEDLQENEPQLTERLLNNRNVVLEEGCFAYLLGKKAVYVKRVWVQLYKWGGKSAFSIPYELKPRLEAQLRKTRGQTKLLEVTKE